MRVLKWSFNVFIVYYVLDMCGCVYMLSRPHHDNHKFMCLQNAVIILHTNHLFVKCCDNCIKVFHTKINQCADFVM